MNHKKHKPHKKQDDRYLKQLARSERRQQEIIRRQIEGEIKVVLAQ